MGLAGGERPMVVGAGGLLGEALVRRLERDHADLIAATRLEIDITDRFGLEAEVERLRPTVIVNCAALTDVDGCTRDPGRAMEINAEGAANLARAAAGSGCRLIQISTDFVFDGRSDRPYREDDPTGPIQEYGRSKLEGERRIAAVLEDHLIVRTAWLHGAGGKGFVGAILRRAAKGETLRVVEDQFGSPTWVEDLADGIARLLGVAHRGVVHVVNRGVCSRHALAAAVLAAAGLAERTSLEAIRTAQAGSLARRPAYSALDTGLFARLTGAPLRPWDEALRASLQSGGDRGLPT
jgi:dTDP-4-dehydrorhamnose reductase